MDGRYLTMEEERAVNFVSEDVSSSFNLTVDSGKLEIIYLHTIVMNNSMLKFPEVILMDSTYRCNNHNMPLRSITVIDAKGQF